MVAGQKLRLGIARWAAILAQEAEPEELGEVAALAEIPALLRRRCPPFTRDALRCGLRLLQGAPLSDLVFCSWNGDLAATVQLLEDIQQRTLLSPAQFSLSVHNASAGLLGQALGRTSNHTAIAAGELSLQAGLIDTYTRLINNEAPSVVLVFADVSIPPPYTRFDPTGPNVHLAMLLHGDDREDGAHFINPGRHGGAALARALNNGARALEFSPPSLARRVP